LHLVGKGVISQEDAKRILERAIELNIRGNQDHVHVAKIFERMLSDIAPRTGPKPEKEVARYGLGPQDPPFPSLSAKHCSNVAYRHCPGVSGL
jgi:hypothetical protein